MVPLCEKLSPYFSWERLAQSVDASRKCLKDYPLLQRVSQDWRGSLLKAGLVASTTGFVLAFLSSHWILTTAFLLAAGTSLLGISYHRKVASMMSLKQVVEELSEVSADFERMAQEFELRNQELVDQIDRLKSAVEELTQIEQQFRVENERLTRQVTELTLCVTSLTEGAENLKREIERFASRNQELSASSDGLVQGLRRLEQAIGDARTLCSEVKEALRQKEEGIGEQLQRLERLLQQATDQGHVAEKLKELEALRESFRREREGFEEVRLRYAEERGRLSGVSEALEQLREQFAREITAVSGDLGSNREGLQATSQQLTAQITRIQELLSSR